MRRTLITDWNLVHRFLRLQFSQDLFLQVDEWRIHNRRFATDWMIWTSPFILFRLVLLDWKIVHFEFLLCWFWRKKRKSHLKGMKGDWFILGHLRSFNQNGLVSTVLVCSWQLSALSLIFEANETMTLELRSQTLSKAIQRKRVEQGRILEAGHARASVSSLPTVERAWDEARSRGRTEMSDAWVFSMVEEDIKWCEVLRGNVLFFFRGLAEELFFSQSHSHIIHSIFNVYVDFKKRNDV